MTPIIPLKMITRENLPIVGEKVFELSRLDTYDFRVPDGFCITSDVYMRYMMPLISIMRKIDHFPNRGAMLEAAKEMRQSIQNVRLSPDTVASVKMALRDFAGRGPFAARPSVFYGGTGESAYEGIYATYFDLTEDNVQEIIIKCWQDMFSEEAVLLKSRLAAENEDVHMAILVQEIVDGACIGKLFTANPHNNDNAELLVLAGHPAGHKALFRDPYTEEYHVKKESLAIESRDEEEYLSRLLDDEKVLKLAGIGTEIQEIFRYAKAVEWVADKAGRIWLVQCESIKSWYPADIKQTQESGKKKKKSKEEKIYLYLGSMLGNEEVITQTARYVLEKIFPAKLHFFGGRPYIEVSDYLRGGMISFGDAVAFIESFDCRTARELELTIGSLNEPGQKAKNKRTVFKKAAAIIKAHQKSGGIIKNARPGIQKNARLNSIEMFLSQAEENIFASSDLNERLRAADDLLERIFEGVLKQELLTLLIGLDSMKRLDAIFKKDIARQEEALSFCVQEDDRIIGEILACIGEMAQAFSANEKNCIQAGIFDRGEEENLFLYKKFDEASARIADVCGENTANVCKKFFGRHGFWGTKQMDIHRQGWSEDTGIIFEAVRELLSGEADAAGDERESGGERDVRREKEFDRMARQEQEPDITAETALGKKEMKLVEYTRLVPQTAVRLAYFFSMLFEILKVLTDHAGSYLEGKKSLYDRRDIVYLQMDEIIEALETSQPVAAKVMERKKEHMQYEKLTPPKVMMSGGVIPVQTEQEDQRTSGSVQWKYLHGTGTSPGRYEGSARVIKDSRRIKLIPGEILVIPSMNMGYVPLISQAGGVVSECGGNFSAGNILCMEREIPAIAGVRNCTGIIRSGDMIRIDGRNGAVIKL